MRLIDGVRNESEGNSAVNARDFAGMLHSRRRGFCESDKQPFRNFAKNLPGDAVGRTDDHGFAKIPTGANFGDKRDLTK